MKRFLVPYSVPMRRIALAQIHAYLRSLAHCKVIQIFLNTKDLQEYF